MISDYCDVHMHAYNNHMYAYAYFKHTGNICFMYVENINMEHGKNMYLKINCDE